MNPHSVKGGVSLEGGSNHSRARVTFSDQDSVFTDAEGNFGIQVPPGTYDITVEKIGFLPATKTGLVVDWNMTLPPVELLWGDVNGGGVDVFDVATMAKNLGKTESPWP